ncbi:molybdopterin-dependent oxidoreductase [Sulfurospirillum diekertiae]|uniref:MopB_3 family molybdopterin oxidoreductase n=1 Tax=Sulfurospirillum diekertiae TaxID=1854492 RepID=A0A1Y0HIX7_9BACT|nr:molybdopterin-dependent oxidoreductase [Sulfurospirillum diekertiae]ARU48057.1 MopB_3 family molybdopterin oxidoreductase [Sulfurospirillum diekertiae]ASC92903.1 MopB_3 family molybdopterin oxidoreductase [Sulfurospirillum diekertiae]
MSYSKEKVESILNNGISRRSFLKGLAASGVLTSLPGGILHANEDLNTKIPYLGQKNYQTFRNACPRNCYDTCSIKTYVKDGVMQFIEGATESTYTRGGCCVKGNSYVKRVYSARRLKFPMMQVGGKGSGNWKRISWDYAMETIAKKLLEMKKEDGTLLGAALTKYSGNFGITHYGVEGMFSSIGYTTRLAGTPCWPAGIDAQNLDMGDMWCNDPEEMKDSKFIILWGVNPASNSVHSMKYIYEAKSKGAKVVVIDPIFTEAASKASQYIQIKTGTDGLLALGMAKIIIEANLHDQKWLDANSKGYKEYKAYLDKEIKLENVSKITGIPLAMIKELALSFAKAKPATIWMGYGMQRHTNGGSMIRAIDALVAVSGNIGKYAGGARYGHLSTWGFNYAALSQTKPEGSVGYTGVSAIKGEFAKESGAKAAYTDRSLNINKTARELINAKEPKVRLLWVACKNVFSQDFDRNQLIRMFQQLDLVVVADQFFNETAKWADIVLPVATQFEEYDVNVSYWHYWMTLNEQAIKPLFEVKSDVEIAALLSKHMNKLEAGSCTFPQSVDTKAMTIKEFNPGIYEQFGIKSWEELKNGPVKAKAVIPYADGKFKTPSGKFEFYSDKALELFGNALPSYVEVRKPYDKFRMTSPHSRWSLHSQFQNLEWMEDMHPEPYVYINPDDAEAKMVKEGDTVAVFNKQGLLRVKAKLTDNVQAGTVLMYEQWYNNNIYNVNELVDDTSSDMGAFKTGAPGVALHDTFVNFRKL